MVIAGLLLYVSYRKRRIPCGEIHENVLITSHTQNKKAYSYIIGVGIDWSQRRARISTNRTAIRIAITYPGLAGHLQ